MRPAAVRVVFAIVAAAVSSAAFPLAQQQPPARDAVAVSLVGTAAIFGTVMTDEPDPRPVRRALVTTSLTTGGPGLPRMTSTDDAGRFAFARLPAGNYSAVRVTKPAFVPVTYGETRPGGIGIPITLAAGEQFPVSLKMQRGGVITGTILDEGRPAAGSSVQAVRVRLVNGVRQPDYYVQASAGLADERGIYRIYGAAAGEYLVMARPRFLFSGEVRPITESELEWAQRRVQAGAATIGVGPGSSAEPPAPGQVVSSSPIFYPGTPDAARAALVVVAAGQERSGIDFSLEKIPTSTIDGTVIGLDGQPVTTAQVSIVPRTTSNFDEVMLPELMRFLRPAATNGRFTLTGVRAGEYTISARGAAPSPGAPGPGRGGAVTMTLWASADVSVDGRDLTGVELRLMPGLELSGRVAFDEGASLPVPDLANVTVRLQPVTNSGIVINTASPAAVAVDGTFTLRGVTPGRYVIFASAGPTATPGRPGWTMRQANVGDIDAADLPFEVPPHGGVPEIVVRFTDKLAELSGTLLDSQNRPTSQLSIILFPSEPAQWSNRSRRIRPPVRASTQGQFRFTNLLPGEYFMAALADYDPADVFRPEFLEQVAAVAMKVTIGEGEKKVQDLKIAGK